MSEFEDNLWSELVRDHADDIAGGAPTAVATRTRSRPLIGLSLAAAGAVLVLVSGASDPSPAFAVTRNHDGTVTVRILKPTGIAGANAKLRQLGVRAEIVEAQVSAGCAAMPPPEHGATIPPGAFSHAHWTIDPRHVPAGRTLLLGARRDSESSDDNSGTDTTSGSSGAGWVTVNCPTTSAPPWAQRPAATGNSGNSGNSVTTN